MTQDVKASVHTALLKILYRQSHYMLWAEALAATLILFILWWSGSQNKAELLAWYGFMFAISLPRYFVVNAYERLPAEQKQGSRWEWVIMGMLFLSAIGWSLAGTVLLPAQNVVNQALILFLIIGVAATANPFYSPVKKVYATFLVPTIGITALNLILRGTNRRNKHTRSITMKRIIASIALLGVITLAIAKTNAPTPVSFLQTAKEAVIMPVPGKPGEYFLKLKKADPYVSYFADRPSRVTGLLSLKDYLAKWEVSGTQGFKGNPPNVALESMSAGQHHQKPVHLIGTLSNATYDVKHGTVRFQLHLNGKYNSAVTRKQQLGYTVLFVDGADIHWNPGGYGPGTN